VIRSPTVGTATYEDIELAGEGVPDGVHELLPVGAHGDVADGDGDPQALLGPPAAALLQLRRVAGARVDARAEPCQLLHDRVPDPLAPAGDQRRRAGQAPPLAPARRRHLLSVSLSAMMLWLCGHNAGMLRRR
jgi:hypothetical protein